MEDVPLEGGARRGRGHAKGENGASRLTDAERGGARDSGRGGRGGRGGRARGRGGNDAQRDNETSKQNEASGNAERQATETPHGSRRGRGRGRGGRGRGGQGQEDDDYGQASAVALGPTSRLPLVKRNTEDFEPSFKPADMRVVVDVGVDKPAMGPLQVRDVVYCPMIFSRPEDRDLYSRLVAEIQQCRVPQDRLIKSWHNDSHWIADDKTGWKRDCPTFNAVCERIARFFKMNVQATRFNWYKDTSEWKPFHHDAAALKADRARSQNFTAAVSFGATRDAAFEHAKSRQVISFPQPDGAVYCFSRDTNILWRHGILQEKPEQQREEGRVSVILWGWVDQEEVD